MIALRFIVLALPIAASVVPAAVTAKTVDASHAPALRACPGDNFLATVDRARSGTTPCVAGKHVLILETGYYQNASAVGGTALAAYPLATVRYGVSARTEVFIAPATRIAKSGLNGAGIYTWSRSGGGVRYALADSGRNALSLNAQYTPQSDETASLATRERFDFGAADRFALAPDFAVSAAVGNIVYTQESVKGNQQSDLYGRLTLSQNVSPNTVVNVLVGRDSQVAMASTPQTKLGLALQDKLSRNAVGDVEIGSALNATGDTKAHYLGFGVSFKH